jgi:CheY-like chemotaxis protein
MLANRVLVVDDDEIVRMTLTGVLEQSGFAVTCASNVVEALRCITSESYDVLLSDLHMPGAGDGLTVVSAMRHANPSAVTLLLSAFPHMEAAAEAILLQTDEVLLKPMDVTSLVHVIEQRIAVGPVRNREIVSVGEILDRSVEPAIAEWYGRVEKNRLLMSVPMTCEVRCGHLPQVFQDLVLRLASPELSGGGELLSPAAALHGLNRHRLGYTAAMLVEESRLLQVCIFHCLQNNLANVDFSVLLTGVMTIADEVDSQLGQAMSSFVAASLPGAPPAWA